MQKFTDFTYRFGRKVRQEQGRPDERGFTLAETLFVLTLAAFGIIGAVLLFNAATQRMTGNRYSTVLQTFSVDNAQIRQQHLVDLGVLTIPTTGGQVPFATNQALTAPDVNVPDITNTASSTSADELAACRAAGGFPSRTPTATLDADCCETNQAGAATCTNDLNTTMNPNHRRVMNMASVVREGSQWIIRIGQNETISVAWANEPTTIGTDYGFTASTTMATLGCPTQTAILYVLAMDPPKSVCDSVADGMSQQDQWNTQCFDTSTGWSLPASLPDSRQTALVACLSPR